MTSAISATPIDANYPVAGIDNNSQGFRDNFNYIKIGLTTATSEITDLQNNTAKLNEANNFNGSLIENATVNTLVDVTYNAGTITGTSTFIDTSDATYQSFVLGNDVLFTFTTWPTSGLHRKVTLELRSDGSARTATFTTTGGGLVVLDSSFPSPFIVSANTAKTYFVEAWTRSSGSTVFLKYLGEFA